MSTELYESMVVVSDAITEGDTATIDTTITDPGTGADLRVASVYVHTGDPAGARADEKDRFLDAVRESGLDAVDFDFGGDYDPFAVWRAFRVVPPERLVALGPEAFLDTLTAKSLADVDEWQTEMQLKPMRIGKISRVGGMYGVPSISRSLPSIFKGSCSGGRLRPR